MGRPGPTRPTLWLQPTPLQVVRFIIFVTSLYCSTTIILITLVPMYKKLKKKKPHIFLLLFLSLQRAHTHFLINIMTNHNNMITFFSFRYVELPT